ncbi:hypothetical protein DSCO28_30360 [Desulfosarcina ovata subsp. sediminis]|uniref:Uncharacterized protein n=1 Tax=Desulfosarcina ovata subsp. sediminis TaxID=885957 RepID=A0A5K7ZQX8_9BACT|nr:hypothetical protein [Desulfosarcina ovata]BBO82470.1 hypothetical protein DSCO28_30360 [Desulfosarcina ovata subsp. sediminis]
MKLSELMAKKSDLPNPSLPPTCPFNTGGHAPAGCRFSHDLLMNLIYTGVMPDPEVGCMFKGCCGELPERKRPVEPPAPAQCFGLDCDYVSRHDDAAGALWCSNADKAVIDLKECPRQRWVRNKKGMPRKV